MFVEAKERKTDEESRTIFEGRFVEKREEQEIVATFPSGGGDGRLFFVPPAAPRPLS